MSGRSFVLIIVDRDGGEFTVEGPMTDDRPWNKAVVEAPRVGRKIRCFGMGDVPPDAAAAEWRELHGGRRVVAGSIVTPEVTVPSPLSRSRRRWILTKLN